MNICIFSTHYSFILFMLPLNYTIKIIILICNISPYSDTVRLSGESVFPQKQPYVFLYRTRDLSSTSFSYTIKGPALRQTLNCFCKNCKNHISYLPTIYYNTIGTLRNSYNIISTYFTLIFL